MNSKNLKKLEYRVRWKNCHALNFSEQKNLKRDLYDSIEKTLSGANKQIKDTKKALGLPNALGLIILENAVAENLSSLSLVDAANRKMLGGLVDTDGVLCLDFVNTFSNSEGKQFRFAQLVSRDTKESKILSEFINQLIREFCEQSQMPLLPDWHIEKGSQEWFIDENGKYKMYTARVDFKSPVSGNKNNWKQKIAHFLYRWWWIIPLPSICYDCYNWFVG